MPFASIFFDVPNSLIAGWSSATTNQTNPQDLGRSRSLPLFVGRFLGGAFASI